MIPKIDSYRMPAAEELPQNLATWRPSPDRAVVLIHDMQQYFIDFFPAASPPVTELVGNIARIRQAAIRMGIPVAYTAQPGGMSPDQRGLLRDFWGPGMDRRTEHRRIIAELAPSAEDLVITKWRYSAFYRSELIEFLHQRNRDQLIICGVYAHVGCLMTACDALASDIQAFLVADGTADFDRASHDMALEYAAKRCAVTIRTDDLIGKLCQPAQGVVHG